MRLARPRLPIALRQPAMILRLRRGYDVMVACQLPKLIARVRFPLPAPAFLGHNSIPGGTAAMSNQPANAPVEKA
jgi:hypothetical protein